MSSFRGVLAGVLAVSMLQLFGCGGGGSSSTPTAAPAATATGIFLDAPSQGVTYVASPSGLTGTTGANGSFSYGSGDTVTFSLNVGGSTPIVIGSLAPVAPTGGGNAVVFVLTLSNGLQVAQVLPAR